MKTFQIRPLDKGDRDAVVRFLEEHWGSAKMVTRGQVHDADELPGFIALQREKPVGLATYRMDGDECEIVTMNNLINGIGIGSALLEAVRDKAVSAKCKRLWLVTTNDNTAALRYYQKKGFLLVALHRNSIEKSRRLKPEIPLTGMDGIPIRDEIELQLPL